MGFLAITYKMKTKLAIRLKTLLQKKNLTESELSRQTGVGQPVIHRMASGETDNPKIETLKPIAKFFSISLEQLIGDAPLTNDYPNFYFDQKLTTLPLITLAQATSWLNGQQINLHTQVQTDLKTSLSAFALQLKDSTMYPMFPDGTLLIIEPSQIPSHKDFVVVQIDDHPQAIFKQLLIDGKDRYLKSVNNDYPTLKMQKKDKILGVMLQARIDFRQN